MDPVSIQGEAFSEYFLRQLMWEDHKLREQLDEAGARQRYSRAVSMIRRARRELDERQSARSTQRLLLRPLSELLGWRLGTEATVATSEGEERAGMPLLNGDEKSVASILALAPDVDMDSAPQGRHRRFAPVLSIARALQEQGLNYGLLLNAYRFRLVRRAEGFVASWVDLDLSAIAEGTDAGLEAWRTIWALLRQAAWEREPRTLDEVISVGRDHAARVNVGLGQQVQQAVVAFIQGVLDRPENVDKVGRPPSREQLDQLYRQSLRVLYRILFALYAEDRGLLPVDVPTYRDGYSVRRLSRWISDPQTDPRTSPTVGGRFVEASLRALFDLLRTGADLGPEGRIPMYGGGLFDPRETELVDSLRWGEATCAEIIDRMTWVPAGPRGSRVHLSYRELDVEQLGSVYETMLEQSVDCAVEPMWRIRLDDRPYVVTEAQREDLAARRGEVLSSEVEALLASDDEDEEEEEQDADEEPEEEAADEEETQPAARRKPIRVLGHVEPGKVFLRTGMGRKQTGSYYTNRAFVDFLVRRTCDPLAEGKKPHEILSLKVVDPAMGSGHFLVGACRRLAEHLLAAYRDMDPDEVPQEVTRVWHDEERALAACRLLVAAHCIYGVDKNPLAVDLARVSLWLATAAADHPLTFLDHRLRVGDSLLGMRADDAIRPWAPLPTKKGSKPSKKSRSVFPLVGRPLVLEELYEGAGRQLRERLRRAFGHLKTIRQLADERPEDLEAHRLAYQAMAGELEPFWDLHQLRIGLAFVAEPDCEVTNSWLRDIGTFGFIRPETREQALTAWQTGRELQAFCWDLTFPDVWFDGEGKPKHNGGFDVVIGNPPWEKVKPELKEFYARFDPAVFEYQAQALSRRIAAIHQDNPGVAAEWQQHQSGRKLYAAVLGAGGMYQFQSARVRGRATGGDPDLFKFFVERSTHLLGAEGRGGVLVPDSLYSEAGCTGLRHMLLEQCELEALLVFQNRRRRFFPTHGQFKFVVLPFVKRATGSRALHAAFLLTDESWLLEPWPHLLSRTVRVTRRFIELTSPGYLAVVEVRGQWEVDLCERLYKTIPPLAAASASTWRVSFVREVDMRGDNYLFRTRDWLLSYDCLQQHGESWASRSQSWYQSRPDRFVQGQRHVWRQGSRTIVSPDPPADEEDLGKCVVFGGFLLSERAADPDEMPVRPEEHFTPLYEGRLVRQFDHLAKAYVSGEAARAVWHDAPLPRTEVVPHFFVSDTAGTGPGVARGPRAAFCRVSNQSNERTMLATVVPGCSPCGDRVPTVAPDPSDRRVHLVFVALANGIVTDWLVRQRVNTTVDFFTVEQLPLPRVPLDDPRARTLALHTVRLSCFTQHMADLWEEMARHYPEDLSSPWRPELAATDLRERARLRAEIDAIVADLYGLSVEEFAYILTTFPLLDRSQPALPGDVFIRQTNRSERIEPRSYITRDTALLEYCRYKGAAPPEDIVAFYADIGVDISRQTSPIRNLEERVAEATRLGAIAYVPTPARRRRREADA